MNKILIGIPCFNCSSQVIRVANSLKKISLNDYVDIIFIDNCSTDDTYAQLMHISTFLKCRIIQNSENLGLGGSQKVLINYSIEHEYDALIILHGDDQADCEDISHLIDRYNQSPMHYLGSRFMSGSKRVNYQKSRVVGNIVLNYIFSLCTLRRIKDLGSGLNLFKTTDLKEIELSKLSNYFNFNVDLLLRFIDLKHDFDFIPITWRETDQVSNARNFKVAFSMLSSLYKWLLNKLKREK